MAERAYVIGDLFHGRVPDNAYYAGRAAPGLKQSPLRNPFTTKNYDADTALAMFREHFLSRPDLVTLAQEIADSGMDFACWRHEPCHVDVILAVVEGGGHDGGR